jgi:hypothetical protein
MIYDLAKSLHEGRGVTQGLDDVRGGGADRRGVVEVIGLCGYYTLVSMTLKHLSSVCRMDRCRIWREVLLRMTAAHAVP